MGRLGGFVVYSNTSGITSTATASDPGCHGTQLFAYNFIKIHFIKIHRTLRMSPAMAAGVTVRVALWEAYLMYPEHQLWRIED
jgi:hypothetical protein